MPIPAISHIPKPLQFYSSQLHTISLHQTFGYNTGLKVCVWLMTSQEGPGLLFSFIAFVSPWFHTQAAFSFLTHDFRLSQCKIPVFYPEQPSSRFPLTYTVINHSIHSPFLNITRGSALLQYVQISSVLKDLLKTQHNRCICCSTNSFRNQVGKSRSSSFS